MELEGEQQSAECFWPCVELLRKVFKHDTVRAFVICLVHAMLQIFRRKLSQQLTYVEHMVWVYLQAEYKEVDGGLRKFEEV